LSKDSGRQTIKYWWKREFEKTENVFNTTTILGMVVVFIETGIETVGTDYRSEQRSAKKSIAFRRDDNKG